MKINILTLFPEMFTAVTESSILGRAGEKGILDVNLINIRDFSKDKHRKTDDTPFGGGPGMVMSAQPVFDALRSLGLKPGDSHRTVPDGTVLPSETDGDACTQASCENGKNELAVSELAASASGIAVREHSDEAAAAGGCPQPSSCSEYGCDRSTDPSTSDESSKRSARIYMSPRGRLLDRRKIEELAQLDELTILCGHYEGVDQRILDAWDLEEISVGDYILTGGELPAMVLIDSVSRFIPDVLGTKESATEESIYSGLLEHDQYTKPREYEGMSVPEVLVNGNHKLIHLWQYECSLRLTAERRGDLLRSYLEKEHELTKDEKRILDCVLSKAQI